MTNILDCIANIRVKFLNADLKPPSAILLSSHEEGMRLLGALHQKNFIYTMGAGNSHQIIEHPDGSVWMEAEILGMVIRWPAKQMAIRDGGYVWG